MRKKISIVCMTVGVLLIAAAVALSAYNYYEEKRAADAADNVMSLLHQAIGSPPTSNELETNPPELPFEETDSDKMTVMEIDGYGYIGYLSIPALDLELPVMSEWDYSRLKIAPCLYYGSVKTDNMVIAAHNYTKHFGKLSNLKLGDVVRFTDMEGIVYTYRVGDIEILPSTATEEMIVSGWNLSLYTCTYGGTSRVTIRCKLTGDEH